MELYSLTYRKSKFNGGVTMKKWMIAVAVVGCVMAEVLAMNLSTDKISAETVETITESMQAIDSGYYTVGENQVHWEYGTS